MREFLIRKLEEALGLRVLEGSGEVRYRLDGVEHAMRSCDVVSTGAPPEALFAELSTLVDGMFILWEKEHHPERYDHDGRRKQSAIKTNGYPRF